MSTAVIATSFNTSASQTYTLRDNSTATSATPLTHALDPATRYVKMSASSSDFDMKRFHFVRAPYLNKDEGKSIAKLHLQTGRLRRGIQILDLERNTDRLESLVSMLQCNWGPAAKYIKGVRAEPNEDSGELSSSSPSIFVFGRGSLDHISGRNMLRAVMNMVVLVVSRLIADSQEALDERVRGTHEAIVVAMFVEAIFAVQHDEKSAFATALFGDSLEKVAVYSSIEQRPGENDAAFHLRTVEQQLRESEAIRIKDWRTHDIVKVRCKKLVEKNEALEHALDVDRRIMERMAGAEIELGNTLKEEKSKCAQLEHDLEESKSKGAQAERDLKEEKSRSAQLERDLNKEKSKLMV